MVAIDVTDQTFQSEVLEKSKSVPVVVDLWAPWCGPCRTLGPMIEKVVSETNGKVMLAKVNVDENPGVSQAFRVQSIPAVFAIVDGQVADNFVGALPEHQIREFVSKLAPVVSKVDELLTIGDEDSLRSALEEDPSSDKAAAALAELLFSTGRASEAEELLKTFPETAVIARVKSRIRLGLSEFLKSEQDVENELLGLLDKVKADEEARQRYVDLLTVFAEDDDRVRKYRRLLTSRLF